MRTQKIEILLGIVVVSFSAWPLLLSLLSQLSGENMAPWDGR